MLSPRGTSQGLQFLLHKTGIIAVVRETVSAAALGSATHGGLHGHPAGRPTGHWWELSEFQSAKKQRAQQVSHSRIPQSQRPWEPLEERGCLQIAVTIN